MQSPFFEIAPDQRLTAALCCLTLARRKLMQAARPAKRLYRGHLVVVPTPAEVLRRAAAIKATNETTDLRGPGAGTDGFPLPLRVPPSARRVT